MRKNVLYILSITLLLSFSNCKKELPKPPIEKEEKTPIIWTYNTETNAGLAMNNYIYKNMIIQGNQTESWGNSMKIWAVTLYSGKLVWESEVLPISLPTIHHKSAIKDNLLFVSGGNSLYAINLDDGKTVWSYDDPTAQSSIGLSVIGEFVYFSIASSRIIQFELQTGISKTILTLDKTDLDNFGPRLAAPSFWKHPNGDEILIMGNSSYNRTVTNNFDRFDMLAFNLTADTMLWYKKGTPGIRGTTSSPLVLNDKVIFHIERKVECINPLNGESIWTHTRHPSDNSGVYRSVNITSWNNILIAKPSSRYMYGVDLNTGQEIWVNTATAESPYTIKIVMDRVWYGSGGVNCIDARTGKSLIDKWRYQNKGSWLNPIAVDEKTGYIYTTAEGVIYCLDANMLMEK